MGSTRKLTDEEKEMEEKERILRESIQLNYSRIRDVEKELSDLQLELHVNVAAPKKHALELLRRKIEVQTERVHEARATNDAAQRAAAIAAEKLAQEEMIKQNLCQELNVLISSSSSNQMRKLEQLKQRLESLTAGLVIADHEVDYPVEVMTQNNSGNGNGNGNNSNNVKTSPSSPNTNNTTTTNINNNRQQQHNGHHNNNIEKHTTTHNSTTPRPSSMSRQNINNKNVKECRDTNGVFRGFE